MKDQIAFVAAVSHEVDHFKLYEDLNYLRREFAREGNKEKFKEFLKFYIVSKKKTAH